MNAGDGSTTNGVINVNPAASITYSNSPYDGCVNWDESYPVALSRVFANHITEGFNPAGYVSYGAHSSLGIYYTDAFGTHFSNFSTNGFPKWSGNSGWWIIETVESFNGQRQQDEPYQSNFIQWFSPIGFGGTNYSNTPVGAICFVDEPSFTVTDSFTYFGLWESGHNSAICAWIARNATTGDTLCQAVGDPLVAK